ncbi:MAG: hypothetical protein Q8J59_03810 [Methylotenera sp.]|nr:hypothetical protein [Methylotenera sp.]MDP2280797.1 hypothetical protein [Methylotenera sp.]MDP3061088.1 hypothetical protein [Methylotenera sp.]
MQTCQSNLVSTSITQVIECLAAQFATLAKAIQQHIDQDHDLKADADLLASIPAVGAKTVPWLLAVVLREASRLPRLQGYRHGNGSLVLACMVRRVFQKRGIVNLESYFTCLLWRHLVSVGLLTIY